MNHTARPDGAICLERQPVDRLPNVVAVSNRGDADGEIPARDEVTIRSENDVTTMRPPRVRAIAHAYRMAFDAWDSNDVALNRPYIGGHETTTAAPMLRALEPRAVVRVKGDQSRGLRFGAFQNEFLREFLLGPDASAHLMQPGSDWVYPPEERVDWLAGRLRHAHDLVRAWGDALAR
jgi:hypothetical protein